MKKVLVAGATGYLGRHVVRELKSRGYQVRALVRSTAKIDATGPNLEPPLSPWVDEFRVGEATRPETIADICSGVDIVFSSLGMTKPDFVHSCFDVDYRANLNILHLAMQAKVAKFVYVSVFNAHKMMDIQNIQAHEKFVDELRASGMNYAIIRPTGYFSDMAQFLRMAKNGFSVALGNGDNRSNPIHGADLATVCVDAIEGDSTVIEAGGPDTFTFRQINDLAAEIAGTSPMVIPLPLWLVDGVAGIAGLVNRDVGDAARFASAVSKTDSVAPAFGTRHLKDYFIELATGAGH